MLVLEVFKHTLTVSLFVFVMMMLTDYLNVISRGNLSRIMAGGQWRQYVTTSFLGMTPGCLGAFLNVSFYIHGLVSFGAITAGMIATSGDETFVMLALFPEQALLLMGILFVLGLLSGWLIDHLPGRLHVKPDPTCNLQEVHHDHVGSCCDINLSEIGRQLARPHPLRLAYLLVLALFIPAVLLGWLGPSDWEFERYILLIMPPVAMIIVLTVPDHYLKEHIGEHILRRHLWKIFLWTFGALLLVQLGLQYWNLESFIQGNMLWVLIAAGIIAIIPQSGPHLIFVALFADGLLPFSVLLTSAIVQDGHGMLPLLSCSVRDALRIKLFKLVIGLGLGLICFAVGW